MEELFPNISPEALEKLKPILHSREFNREENIFVQGAPSKAIYFVTKGRVKIARVTKEGYETVLCVRGPGDTFCPVPVLDKGEHLGTAVALTDVELMWAEQGEFMALANRRPELLAYLQGDCLSEVRRLLGRMEAFAFRSVSNRLAFTLLDMIDRQAEQGETALVLKLKQQELAGLVGSSRESISRTLSAWEEKGIITTHRGKLVIEDEEKLRTMIE